MNGYGSCTNIYINSALLTPKETIRILLCNEGELGISEIKEMTGFEEMEIKKYINDLVNSNEISLDAESGKYFLTPTACKELYDIWGSLIE